VAGAAAEWSRTEEDVGVVAADEVTGREVLEEGDVEEEETALHIDRRGCEVERVPGLSAVCWEWEVRGRRESLSADGGSGVEKSQSERAMSLKSANDRGRGREGGAGG